MHVAVRTNRPQAYSQLTSASVDLVHVPHLVGGYTQQDPDAEKRAKFIEQVAQRNQRQRVTCLGLSNGKVRAGGIP